MMRKSIAEKEIDWIQIKYEWKYLTFQNYKSNIRDTIDNMKIETDNGEYRKID